MYTHLNFPKILLLSFTVLCFIFTETVLSQTKSQSQIQTEAESYKDRASLELGAIDFPTSASGKAQQEFMTGVLALHSFWYPEARTHFKNARTLDPNFALAYWGEAMTYDHPVWGQHDQSAGKAILEKMDNRKASLKWDKREKQYVAAVKKLYNDADKLSMYDRRRAYAEAMDQLTADYPLDDEALVFAALANLTVPDYDYNNPDVRDLVPIAANLEELYQRNPSHPGALHYLIHLYDNEKFAEMGLRPARQYADIAYSSSHAIHMPSHIYKHLEMWPKVIESNIAAWNASIEWQQETDRPLDSRDYHSYRWLFDAYMEIQNYTNACSIIKNLSSLKNEALGKSQEADRISRTLKRIKDKYQTADLEKQHECTVES